MIFFFQRENPDLIGDRRRLDELREMVERNELQPVLEKSFSLKQADHAARYVLERGDALVGKVAIRLTGDHGNH